MIEIVYPWLVIGGIYLWIVMPQIWWLALFMIIFNSFMTYITWFEPQLRFSFGKANHN